MMIEVVTVITRMMNDNPRISLCGHSNDDDDDDAAAMLQMNGDA